MMPKDSIEYLVTMAMRDGEDHIICLGEGCRLQADLEVREYPVRREVTIECKCGLRTVIDIKKEAKEIRKRAGRPIEAF